MKYRIKIKKGNDEVEVEGDNKEWVSTKFEDLRKKYIKYWGEK